MKKELKKLQNYKTLIFDCDGVLLDSNSIKTNAFFEVCSRFGVKEANALVNFHKKNGGISRYKKFDYFFRNILLIEPTDEDLKNILVKFSKIIKNRLKHCSMTPVLKDLRKINSQAKWMIVSGGDQSELRSVFSYRKIHKFFNAGIYGSPRSKNQIIDKKLKEKKIQRPVLFFGDSEYDFEVSQSYDFDFIFVSDWSEVSHWKTFCQKNNIPVINRLSKILEYEY